MVHIETERLVLDELCMDDLPALFAILSDEKSMRYYPHAFDEETTARWIRRNLERYGTDGFGLWAVRRKSDGCFLGDTGITMQNIHGTVLPEIGYHIAYGEWNKGYATEAARACKKYAFEVCGFPEVYSYMKYDNLASRRVAEKNGMHLVEEYPDPVNLRTAVYGISRDDYFSESGKPDTSEQKKSRQEAEKRLG